MFDRSRAPAMPIQIEGEWRQVLAEDFKTPCKRGHFLETYPGWTVYPDTWDNGHTSYYNGGKSISVAKSRARLRFYTDVEDKPRTETLRPPEGKGREQTYGRYSLCYRVPDSIPGYKQAFLLWPGSNKGADGEIDFPEASFDLGSTIRGYVHEIEPPGSHGTNAYAFDTNTLVTGTGWHVVTIEWRPDSVSFIKDGVYVGNYESAINVPAASMTWRIQTEGNLSGSFSDSRIDPLTRGRLDLAWVCAWEMA